MTAVTAPFADRRSAGKLLADSLAMLGLENPVVVAVPRAGVVVGAAVAEKLGCPLFLTLVRRLPVPDEPAVGFGSVALAGGAAVEADTERELKLTTVVEAETARELKLTTEDIDRIAKESVEILRGWQETFADHLADDLSPYDVILVDDVMIGGYSMLAAADAVKAGGVRSLTAAVPVATAAAANRLEPNVDRLICLVTENLPTLPADGLFPGEPEPDDQAVLECLRKPKCR